MAPNDGEILATDLAFPEGPVWLDGSLVFTELAGGTVARLSPDGTLDRFATTGGSPNGAVAGPDGTLLVTQNGGLMSDDRVTPGIQRVTPGGAVSTVVTEIAGLRLDAPNDLAFGPDGRLFLTDPRGVADPARNERPGRLFAVDLATGEGELLAELGPVYPNGIAFLADGTLVWTESFSRRVLTRRDGTGEVLLELPERHHPDGMCVGADGALYVASTMGHCVSVIVDGQVVDRLVCGNGMPTNCCFGGGDLYVTESRHGTVWRFADVGEGLPLHTGSD